MKMMWVIIEWVMGKMKTLGAACLVGMTFLTCADIIGRFFRHPIFGSEEIVEFMAVMAVAMALPYADKIKSHVGVEILVRLLSDRTQTIIDIATRSLSFVFFVLVTWQMGRYARTMQKSGEVSMSLELPEYVVIYATAFCFVIFTLIILEGIMNDFRKLKNK